MEKEIIKYDVIIIGAGPAGMASALYASRADLNVCMLEKGDPGGELLNTDTIENYLGFESVQGVDLAEKMYESAMSFGTDHVYGDVRKIGSKENGLHQVHTSENIFEAPVIIIATGANNKKLGVKGEEEYAGMGVSYCAICDGIFFKDKNLKVVGGGNSAIEEGAFLTQYASNIDIIHRRDTLRADKILQDRIFNNDKVSFNWNKNVIEIKGDGSKVTGVTLVDSFNGDISEESTDGVFIYVGQIPNTGFIKNLNIMDDEGWIITNNKMETSINGIYAAGDVRQKDFRQIANAVGEGSQAGQEAFNYIQTFSGS